MFGDISDGTRLLVVEDERNLAAGLKLNFELEGFSVQVARTARDAAARVLDFTPHLILLDVMLPDADGFSLCRRLRDAGNFTPVLMLTARGSTDDRILGLEAGADDYLTKPFDFSELLARVKSMMRRQEWARAPEEVAPDTAQFTFGDVEVDFDAHEVKRAGEEIKLTRLELDLLRYFADHQGRVLSREELQAEVWKLDNYPNSRMVDNFILRLRKHFEPDPSNPQFFISVRGAGYKFEPERE